MKQLFILFIAASLFTSCNNNKTDRERRSSRTERDDYNSDDKKNRDKDNENSDEEGWSKSDIASFKKQCLQEFPDEKADLAEKVCPCLLDKMEAKYASLDEMDSKSTESEGKRAFEDCVESLGLKNNSRQTSSSNWTSTDRSGFIRTCVNTATANGGMSQSRAESYCTCMQENLESMYPDKNDANELDADAMDSPEMKRVIKSCISN